MHVEHRDRQSTVMQTAGAVEATDPSALFRGVAHGLFLSALIWAAIGWTLTLLRQ